MGSRTGGTAAGSSSGERPGRPPARWPSARRPACSPRAVARRRRHRRHRAAAGPALNRDPGHAGRGDGRVHDRLRPGLVLPAVGHRAELRDLRLADAHEGEQRHRDEAVARPEDNDERRQERVDIHAAARRQVQRRDAVRRQHAEGRLHPHHHGEARGRLDPVHLHHRPGQADRREGPGHGRDGPRHPRAAVRPAARLAVRHRHREPERGEAGERTTGTTTCSRTPPGPAPTWSRARSPTTRSSWCATRTTGAAGAGRTSRRSSSARCRRTPTAARGWSRATSTSPSRRTRRTPRR